jgi:hypothetical protein
MNGPQFDFKTCYIGNVNSGRIEDSTCFACSYCKQIHNLYRFREKGSHGRGRCSFVLCVFHIKILNPSIDGIHLLLYLTGSVPLSVGFVRVHLQRLQ